MPRPIVEIAVCYLMGLVVGNAWTYWPWTTAGFSVVVFGLAYTSYGGKGRLIRFCLWIALVSLGAIRFQMVDRMIPSNDLARFATGQSMRFTGVIDGPLFHGPESTRLLVKVRSVGKDGIDYPTRGTLRLTVRDFSPDLHYGDLITAAVRLRPISGLRNFGGFDYSAYLRREGIRAYAVVHRPEAITRLSSGGFVLMRRIYAWRERIREALNRSLSPVSSAILQAMLIGETGSLNAEIREAFMISGTTHLLSISGSHLAMVAVVVFNLSGRILRLMPAVWIMTITRRLSLARVRILATLFPVVFYTLLAGGQVATVRSLIMIVIYLTAVWFQRAGDPLNALSVAVLLTVLWNPQAILSISFQLSYMAVLAMVLGGGDKVSFRETNLQGMNKGGLESGWTGRWIIKIRLYLWITVLAESATLPLTAFYFNQISWLGFLSNLIAVPLVGMVIVPLGLACSVWAVLFDRTTLPLAGLNEALATLLYTVVGWFARVPGSEVHVPSPPLVVLASLYIAMALVLFFKGSRLLKWGAFGLCILIAALWVVRLSMTHSDGRLRVTFLDVGQGDSAWIEFPDGKTMLIDGGGAYGNYDLGRLVVSPYLWNTGHWRIDYMVASHPQLDHMGGLVYVARKFHVGELWTNGLEKDAVFFERFRKVVSFKGISKRRIRGTGRPLLPGSVRVTALHPQLADPAGRDNNQSLVIRIAYRRQSFLFTGDIETAAERELLRWGNRLKTTVLKVPHHGSRTSIDSDFLARVAPDISVISVGANNAYRHPSVETLSAYRALATRIYRTDRDGAVYLETDGVQRTVKTYRDVALHPVSWGQGMAVVEGANLMKIFRSFWFGPP